jgi:chromosome segregation ATPase
MAERIGRAQVEHELLFPRRQTYPRYLHVAEAVAEEEAQAPWDGLGGRLKALRREVVTGQAEVKEVKADVAEVKAGQAEVKADVAEVKAKVDVVEAKLEAKLDRVEAKLEAGLADMKALLEKLAAQR